MSERETQTELDKLRKRYGDLGGAIEELIESISRSSSTTEAVLTTELTRARMELASIARRLKELSGE